VAAARAVAVRAAEERAEGTAKRMAAARAAEVRVAVAWAPCRLPEARVKAACG
tara:strand:- start:1438 stop:1596 length:159 start_codon:yes stop_codon:yes gene_type:complete